MEHRTHTQARLDRWSKTGLIFLFWTLIGLSFASQFYLSSYKAGRPVSWRQAVSWSLGDWYVWAVLSLPVIRFARRYPPEAGVSWRIGFLHLGAALLCSLAFVGLRALVGQVHGWVIDEPVTFAEVFRPLLVKTFPFNLLIYGVGGLLLQFGWQSLDFAPLPGWIAAAVMLLLALPVTRLVAAVLGGLLPRDETQVISERTLVGRIAVVVIGTARRGSPAQAKLRDEFRTTHYLMVEPMHDHETFQQGDEVLLTARHGAHWRAVKVEVPAIDKPR